jgi:hypothetical protein
MKIFITEVTTAHYCLTVLPKLYNETAENVVQESRTHLSGSQDKEPNKIVKIGVKWNTKRISL